jgi:phenylalanyl-tRNA synthetase alpha chain
MDISSVRELLLSRIETLDNKSDILKAVELRSLFDQLKFIETKEDRAIYGKQLNDLRNELANLASNNQTAVQTLKRIDVSAPIDVNQKVDELNQYELIATDNGSLHPLMTEMDLILDIFYRLGFKVVETPEIDDDYHMFGSLNFPEGHPARDDFDTLVTKQLDKDGRPFVAPAHTSTMQIRVLKEDKDLLAKGQPIAYVIPGRVFRNDDIDARHEHTFYQLEGVYVSQGVTVANLMSTLRSFMSEYFDKEVELKTQPFYFPFTEPSFEFAISCPFCNKAGCSVCSHSGWIELLGCGMIHPNVLSEAGIDSNKYTGFAWGIGFMRLAMIKHGIEDIRHFQSGKLDFLRQF